MKGLAMFRRPETTVEIVYALLRTIHARVTYSTVEKDLLDHPDYPSLLSVSDVMHGYGADNIAFVADIQRLGELPPPFIVQVKGTRTRKNLFAVVRSVGGDSVSYYDPEASNWRVVSKQEFISIWPSRITLILDASAAKGEQNHAQKRLEEKHRNAIRYFSWLSLPVLALIAAIWRLVPFSSDLILPMLFMLTLLAGSVVGVLLLWYELGEYNPILQKICSPGKKVNCGAILNSKASKIAGVSWSAIGFTYFAGGTFTLLFTGVSSANSLMILSWLNTLAVPYTLFSVYYQWRIAKQWCMLCLSVQSLLILQLMIALAAGWHTASPISSLLNHEVVLPFIFTYLFPFAVVNLLLPLYRASKENTHNKAELQRIKHNPQIFDSLLKKNKMISRSTEGLGISIGDVNAGNKIVKVCNPYCQPCSHSHLLLHRLLETNPDIHLQIIYYSSNHEIDKTRHPVKHFLAIAEKNDLVLMKEALDHWYLESNKNYEEFALRYPMNGELKRQDDKLDAMYTWCLEMDIHGTPTIFVNGYELPESYDVNDLKYFLSV